MQWLPLSFVDWIDAAAGCQEVRLSGSQGSVMTPDDTFQSLSESGAGCSAGSNGGMELGPCLSV